MACKITPEPYWICNGFPFRCSTHHPTREQAEKCEVIPIPAEWSKESRPDDPKAYLIDHAVTEGVKLGMDQLTCKMVGQWAAAHAVRRILLAIQEEDEK